MMSVEKENVEMFLLLIDNGAFWHLLTHLIMYISDNTKLYVYIYISLYWDYKF